VFNLAQGIVIAKLKQANPGVFDQIDTIFSIVVTDINEMFSA